MHYFLAFTAAVIGQCVILDDTILPDHEIHGSGRCHHAEVFCKALPLEASYSCDLNLNSTVYSGIQCIVSGSCLNETLESLPPEITNLHLTVDKFPSGGVSFLRFATSLRKLSILWKYDIDAILYGHKHVLNDSDLFKGLYNLESLTISIPIADMVQNLLYDLVNLRELDLTNIGHFTSAKFARLYSGSAPEQKQLRCLILKRISGVDASRDRQFMLKHLWPLFTESDLKVFDVSNNRDVYLYPGLTNSIPRVESVSISGNILRYIDNPREASCLIVELGMHSTLKEVDMSEIGAIGDPIEYVGLDFSEMELNCIGWSPNRCICYTMQALCGQFLPQGNKFQCQFLPEYTADYVLRMIGSAPIPEPFCRGTEQQRSNDTLIKNGVRSEVGITNTRFCREIEGMKLIDFPKIRSHLAEIKYHVTGWYNLEVMNISNSYCWEFFFQDAFLLHKTPKLKIFDASGTNTGIYLKYDVNNHFLKGTKDLEAVYLSKAKMSVIPKFEFYGLGKLRILDLSHNSLSEITFDVSTLTSLELLDLSGNLFHHLTQEAIFEISSLAYERHFSKPLRVNLYDNSFVCDCKSLNFLLWVMNPEPIDLVRRDEYLCRPYKLTHGKIQLTLEHVSVLQESCYHSYIATSAEFGLLLLFIAGICYKFRWKLRAPINHYLHYQANAQVATESYITSRTADTTPYLYDAFIVYAEEDMAHVHRTMLHEVERNMNLRLCVHYRDFTPGELIDDNIVAAIDSSRKTVLILTEYFLKSEWCKYETSVARSKWPTEGKDVIIPIALICRDSDRPIETSRNLTPSIRNILRQKSYYKWDVRPGVNNRDFWVQFRRALLSSNQAS